MTSSVVNARLILLAFAVTEAVLAWSIRFLPYPIKSRLASGIIAIVAMVALFSVLVGEASQYATAKRDVPLKNDHFFLIAFFVQNVLSIIIISNSDSARRRKEKTSRLEK